MQVVSPLLMTCITQPLKCRAKYALLRGGGQLQGSIGMWGWGSVANMTQYILVPVSGIPSVQVWDMVCLPTAPQKQEFSLLNLEN